MFEPTVSLIINTDARAESLEKTLNSLQYLHYPSFEVCVVYGPTVDGTKELLERRQDAIKILPCGIRNLSTSRNIGIAMAAGELVAFLDDDSIPEPEWLSKIVPAFEQQDVAACGGFLVDHTGVSYQWRFGAVDRLGVPDQSWGRSLNEFNFPYTAKFPHVMANSVFRKAAILDIGQFDEQFGYYLDETDLICRLVDRGWRIASIAGAAVHHKFLPSHIRNQGVFKEWTQLIKSKIYFSIINGHRHHRLPEAIKSTLEFVDVLKANLEWGISEGKANNTDRDRFAVQVEQGLQDGLAAGFAGKRQLPSPEGLKQFVQPFLPFHIPIPSGKRRTLCLLTKTYPPAPIGGIGRHVNHLARAMAHLGHQVHVLTRGVEHDTVDFEDGVWVHRICPKPQPSTMFQGVSVPQHIWDYSATMLTEVRRVAESRHIDAVIAPIWDCEGIAFLVDGQFRLVTGLYTTFQQWLQTTGNRPYDAAFMESFIRPMLALEGLLFEQSDGILADSRAIVTDIENAYGLKFDPAKLGLVLLGLEDWSTEAVIEPQPLPVGALRVLFVGRLEARKGIDVLLEAAKIILRSHPQVHFDLVGDHTLLGSNGLTYRQAFEADRAADPVRDRVHFHGEVSEPALRGFYRACDIFVAPSRFESFGLILLEAMMFAKPVIGCRAGGMTEVVEHGVSGLLAEPGDVGDLVASLQQLLVNATLRASLGDAGRRRYLALFTAQSMAQRTLDFVSDLLQKSIIAVADRAEEARREEPSMPEPTLPATPKSRYKVAIVNSILARNDAVSAAVRDMFHMLSIDPALEVTMLVGRNDFSELPCRIVGDSAQLLLEADYLAADLIIWHFGICYEFFDALLLGNGHARQVVVFHNITPKEYVADALWPLIERSMQQCHNLRRADEIWNDSAANAQAARTMGVIEERIQVIPLCVDAPPISPLTGKNSAVIEMLFVGRFVKSKGVLDLIEAVARLPRGKFAPFRLTLAGNLEFSDPIYVDKLQNKIASFDLAHQINLLGTVDDPTWVELYRRAHILVIPSYHEGFCKPVIEGLRAGCIPVGYANSNLPEVAAGLGRLVASGDVDALAAALAALLSALPEALAHPLHPGLTLDRGRLSVAEFQAASRDHVERFSKERIARQLRERTYALLDIEEQLTNAPIVDRRAMAT